MHRAPARVTSRRLRPWLAAGLAALTVGLLAAPLASAAVSRVDTTTAPLSGSLSVGEASGLVASRQYPGVFWWHRDGGTETATTPRAAVYAMKVDSAGALVPVRGKEMFPYFTVPGVKNTNWEDIALDDQNNLWIGDIGANICTRTNQRLIKIAEPNPTLAVTPTVLASYTFQFPDPAAGCTTWNSEAMFWLHGKMYILAKNSQSSVYRVDLPSATTGRATLVKLGSLAGGVGNVSASSFSADRTRFMVSGHGRATVYPANPALRGDALVVDAIRRMPIASVAFTTGTDKKPNVEGGTFRGSGLGMVFVAENKSRYAANAL